eukprot:1243182-Amphidinium_carterae.1
MSLFRWQDPESRGVTGLNKGGFFALTHVGIGSTIASKSGPVRSAANYHSLWKIAKTPSRIR